MPSTAASASRALGGIIAALDRFERFTPYAVGAALFALPFLFPLGIGRDYPNHLARVFIEHRLHLDSVMGGNYTLKWLIVPDLAMDIFAIPLASWLSPYLVGSLFNSLTLLLLFTGTLALSRRGGHAPTSAWPVLAAVVLFNEDLRWGFMNFLFGCGLSLWLLYFWLETEHWPWLRRLLVFSLGQLGLFFAHLLGFLLCGYLILTLELVRLWRDRNRPWRHRLGRLVASQLQFVVPTLLFGYVLLSQEGVGDDTTLYGGLGSRAVAALSPGSALGLPLALVLLSGLGGLIYAALRSFKASFDPQLLPLVIAVFVLVAAMPMEFMGIWGLHFRYPFVLFLLLIAAIRLRPGASGNRLLGLGAAGMAIVVLVIGAAELYRTDRQMQEIRQALRLGEPGSALLVGASYAPNCQNCLPEVMDEIHAGALGAIERQMFVPTLFTATSLVTATSARHDLDVPSGLPKRRVELIRDRNRPLPKRGEAHDARHPYWYSWDRHYDYLLWFSDNGETLDDIAGLEPLAVGEVFVLYRIVGASDGAVTGNRPAALSQ